MSSNAPVANSDPSGFLAYRGRVVEPPVKAWKEQCVSCFRDCVDETLLLNLDTGLSFCLRHLPSKSSSMVYLCADGVRAETPPEDREKRVMGIGVEGGFAVVKSLVNVSYCLGYVQNDSIVKSKEYSVGGGLFEVDAILLKNDASKEAEVKAWREDDLVESKYAKDLIQTVPATDLSDPSQWRCAEDASITTNLWLNLGDGFVGSGRANWDGTGGNGSALRHYQQTNGVFPLAVKLGTLNADESKIDVYSYAEDSMVKDPFLKKHLAHWGFNDLSKYSSTEKTVAEMSIELNASYDWSAISEEGKELQDASNVRPGLENLGNTCYCNSVWQCVVGLVDCDDSKVPSPEDPDFQFNKLVCATKQMYKHPLKPRMLKDAVAKNHIDFKSSTQQDAAEYLEHLIDSVACLNGLFDFQTVSSLKDMQNPSASPSKTTSNDSVFSLRLKPPPTEAVDDHKRPKPCLSFETQLQHTLAPEDVDDYLSPTTNAKGLAVRTINFGSYPKYLAIKVCRYVVDDANWSVKKLELRVGMPLEFRSTLLGECVDNDDDVVVEAATIDPSMLAQFTGMGFSEIAVKKALKAVPNDPSRAMDWLLERTGDPSLNVESETTTVEPSLVAQVQEMGFGVNQASLALKETGSNVANAVNWLFANSNVTDAQAAERLSSKPGAFKKFTDECAYRLQSVVSHIGKNVHSGHYVAHVRESSTSWLFFNDEKVKRTSAPPVDLGYLYIYERV